MVSNVVSVLDDARLLGEGTAALEGITSDSRCVSEGYLFAALRGEHHDGHEFLRDAVKRGAVATLVEEPDPGLPVAQIVVPDTRGAVGKIADAFYGYPSHALSIIGITGTNGKTTTTYLVDSILRSAGVQSGLLGTISYRYGGKKIPAPHTTPEAIELHGHLRGMVDERVTHCVMEVSSHALAQRRVDGCAFTVGVFTNLTQDHLDYHRTMEHYSASKARLFDSLIAHDGWAVINIDDRWGEELAKGIPHRLMRYTLEKDDAEIAVCRKSVTADGIEAELDTPAGRIVISSPLIGEYNLRNIMAAVGCGIALGLERGAIEAGIRGMERVPGRLDRVPSPRGFKAFVDYAHTPDALESVLRSLAEVKKGRIVTVFGCGGDRDRGKRPVMGEVAVRWSDITIITSDNPRGEEPLSIIGEIEGGIEGVRRYEAGEDVTSRGYLVIPDRREAIDHAIEIASEGDIVLVAGKGHEDYQIVGDRRLPFDDRVELKRAIDERAGN
ncbi:MAG: UDP-N-acetylmuramoyl-L-alanyl-D-glutamate--2,6-diaminopimelate ligase [Thermodesulfobacteriota bacterium]